MKKRILIVALVFVLAFSMVGCKKKMNIDDLESGMSKDEIKDTYGKPDKKGETLMGGEAWIYEEDGKKYSLIFSDDKLFLANEEK